jgi:hypothetical protein
VASYISWPCLTCIESNIGQVMIDLRTIIARLIDFICTCMCIVYHLYILSIPNLFYDIIVILAPLFSLHLYICLVLDFVREILEQGDDRQYFDAFTIDTWEIPMDNLEY